MASITSDFLECLRFWSRLPVPASPVGDAPHLSHAISALPIAGLAIAIPAILSIYVGANLALSPLVVAAITVAVLVATTGALHEDGLADAVDGLFGGASPDRRLAIMRDSRIGTFGTLALVASFAIRVAALAALLETSQVLACTALLATAAISRTAGLLPMVVLPPARRDGLGSGFCVPDATSMRIATGLATASLVLPILAGASVSRALLAGLFATAAAYALVPLARKKIGGQTGDIAGAAQQAAEITCLAILSGA